MIFLLRCARQTIERQKVAVLYCHEFLNFESDRAAHITSRASGELPADAQRHGAIGFPKAQRALDRQSGARRSPRRHTDTAERWVSPKARRGHGTLLGPAPAVSPPAHRPSGAAGLTAPLTPHTTSSRRLNRRLKSCRLRRQRCGLRVSTQGPAPPLTGRRSPRQPGGTPTLLTSFHTKEHAPTQPCSRLILRADTNRRRRDRAFQQLHVPPRDLANEVLCVKA